MSTSVGALEQREVREPRPKPLDEAVWQAWVAKGQAHELRSNDARVKAVKWVTAATLLAAVGLGSHLAPYEVMVRFIVTLGSIAVLFQAFRARQYVSVAAFGALALLYNPIAPVFSFSGGWDRVVLLASAIPFFATLVWRDLRHASKPNLTGAATQSVLVLFLVFGVMAAPALARDLSKYRDFQLGTDLATIADQAKVHPSEATVTHSRPVLIQELVWRPQPLGWTSEPESVQKVAFSFYEGELFRIVVDYDLYETEGLTTDDMVDAISATYGTAIRPAASVSASRKSYSDQDDILARWQDPQYSFTLIRASYGRSFTLVGVLKRLEAPAQAAILEATRLDVQEAPERDAARLAIEEEAARAKLDQARAENKPNFRP